MLPLHLYCYLAVRTGKSHWSTPIPSMSGVWNPFISKQRATGQAEWATSSSLLFLSPFRVWQMRVFLRDPQSLSHLWHGSSHHKGTGVEQLWNKLFSDFSQCRQRTGFRRNKDCLSFLIMHHITHPLQRTWLRQLWGCRASGPQTSWQIRRSWH